ncbi:endoplasmic oxidoreductin [Hymenopellis radicata]|nr:endoplasmic oxidoreductin [Hymenopellis radicata]
MRCRLLRYGIIVQALLPVVPASQSLFSKESSSLDSKVHDVLEHQTAKQLSCDQPVPTGPIDATTCQFEVLDEINPSLFETLHTLVATPFFKYFQADLYRECPFWDDHGSCSDPGCAITSVDERDVPERFRATALSKIGSPDRHELPGCYYRDSDFCFLDDNTEGEYYDLSLIPERYTGYSGKDAQAVWHSIYQENCFGISESNLLSGKPVSAAIVPDTIASNDDDDTSQCLEKRVYYKIVSGLHASISTHICLEWLNQTTGEWQPNLQCFVNRIAAHPERLEYIYFNTVLLLRAVSRLSPYLSAYDYCSTGTHEDDIETRSKLDNVISIAQHAGRFDEAVLFRGDNANVLKEEFKTHFRNVTRIMDCIGCDKCRLWGKVQTTGVATALKILFELDERALDPNTNANLLQRSEVVALINTLHRFSESLNAVNIFRHMWSENDKKDDIIQEAHTSALSKVGGREYEAKIREACEHVLRVCRDSTLGCMAMVMQLWGKAVGVISSVFYGSSKAGGPLYGEL